jgi:hypothetical protein
MRYTTNKTVNELLDRLVRAGDVVRVVDTGRHMRAILRNGRFVVFPRSPSDWRSARNLAGTVRRVLAEPAGRST